MTTKYNTARPYSFSYLGPNLDRAAHLRNDEDKLRALSCTPEAQYLLVRHYAHPFVRDHKGIPASASMGYDKAKPFFAAGVIPWFLGYLNDQPQFALDITDQSDETVSQALPDCDWLDLRTIGSKLSADQANILALTRGLSFWHRTNGFCSRCGSQTTVKRFGFERLCCNPDCKALHYPRTDPVVIMLVIDDRPGQEPRCLLGNSNRLPAGIFSTLAGYVEPGESLEQAVAREVLEESGVIVTDCSYRASQPWPFPNSLMIGYRARAISFDIRLDDDEMQDAKWFTRAELRTFGEWGDEGPGFKLPRPDSIARALVEDWLNEA